MGEKAYWPSRWIFILAAIGSAAGLGNLWRFPYLAFEYGGGAFVVATLISVFVVGVPLLILEMALGQKMQKGAADAFGKIKPMLRYVGWTMVVFGFMVVSYYMAVLAWSLDFLGSSFTLAWGNDPQGFFFNEILQLSPSVSEIGGFSYPVLAGLLLAWALVYFSVWKGVESVSAVVKWTVPLPFFILFILIVRALTLDGAFDGLAILFNPEWSALANPQLWLAAFSQVFFSFSLAFGIMIAYGSMRRVESEITKSAVIVAIGDILVSLLSAVVVFGTLGYMAYAEGLTVSEVFSGGPALAFVVFPEVINLLPGFNELIAVLFFSMLLLLAIDSAFSLVEALSISIRDRFPGASTRKISLAITLVGIMAGLIFTTGAGLYFLDIADHFIVNYGLVIGGILESVIVGWFFRKELKEFINEHSEWNIGVWWDVCVRYIIPLSLGVLLIWNIWNEFQSPYEGYPVSALIMVGVVPVILAPFIGFLLDWFTKQKDA